MSCPRSGGRALVALLLAVTCGFVAPVPLRAAAGPPLGSAARLERALLQSCAATETPAQQRLSEDEMPPLHIADELKAVRVAGAAAPETVRPAESRAPVAHLRTSKRERAPRAKTHVKHAHAPQVKTHVKHAHALQAMPHATRRPQVSVGSSRVNREGRTRRPGMVPIWRATAGVHRAFDLTSQSTRTARTESEAASASEPAIQIANESADAAAAAAPPTAGVLAQASPEPTGNATAAPTPSASAPPTIPPLQNLPNGPSQLVPPTPPGSSLTPPPLPTPTPAIKGTSAPVPLERTTGTPEPIRPAGAMASPTVIPPTVAPSASPTAAPLGPNEVAWLADDADGGLQPGQTADANGNVHVFYGEGVVVGDKAHYDGNRTVTLTGNAYIINSKKDTILYADQIVFDTRTHNAKLLNGRGETSEGVEVGKLFYRAKTLTTRSAGVAHGDGAWFSTCENARGGYHVEAKSIDVKANDKLVARKATVFLGAAAIFFLPVVVIPLRTVRDPRRPTTFFPEVGYSQYEGYYEKSKIGFSPSDQYYGYYRVDYFTKRGLGLGYSASLRRRDSRRLTTIDGYTINDRQAQARQSNLNVNDFETLSRHTQAQFGVVYNSNYGPNISLPATFNLTGALTNNGLTGSDRFTFSRYLQGSISDNLNLGFVDTRRLSQALNQALNVSYTKFSNSFSSSSTLHLNTLTSLLTRNADYSLAIDKTNSSQPSGYDKLPELQIRPRFNLRTFRNPIQTTLTFGEYTEQQNRFSTTRGELFLTAPIFLKVLGKSDLSWNTSVRQQYYGTGDAKAFVSQQASLTTPFGGHILNTVSYNEQHPIGPANVPFQLIDRLSSASKSAQDLLRISNGNVYSLALSSGTSFNRQAQPVSYQLTSHPSPRSTVILGGSWIPGAGNGFFSTNVQAATPFGRGTDLEISTNIDWKNKGRLLNKNISYRKIIGDCYDLRATYNQDLKQFNLAVDLLAFPSRSASFGINRQGPIFPQSFGSFH